VVEGKLLRDGEEVVEHSSPWTSLLLGGVVAGNRAVCGVWRTVLLHHQPRGEPAQ